MSRATACAGSVSRRWRRIATYRRIRSAGGLPGSRRSARLTALNENGRRNGDGRGKRTTDPIQLPVDADIATIEARAAGRDVDESQVNSIGPSC